MTKKTPAKPKTNDSIEDIRRVPTIKIARLFRVTARMVGLWHQKSGCPRNDDARTYNLESVIAWREAGLVESIRRKDAVDGSNIERLRGIKADREKIALDRDRGKLINREDVHTALGRLAVILRGAGEAVGKKFGTEAQSILDEALDDFTAEVRRSFAGDE